MIRFPPKRVVVAYDMTDVSGTAWKHAAALAEACGAELDVVYADPSPMGADLLPPPDMTPDRARVLREKMISVVGERTKVTILQGDPAARILAYARQHRADLVVVGTHGRTGLKRAVLGSTAEAIIRSSPLPVLAARGPVRPVRSILAPVNFTAYAQRGLAYAAGTAAVLKADLTALHVTDDPIWDGNIRTRLGVLLERLPAEVRRNCHPEAEVSLGEDSEGILRASPGHDWIVMVAHERSFVGAAVFGTTLERVLRRSSVPLLSVPLPKREAFVHRAAAHA